LAKSFLGIHKSKVVCSAWRYKLVFSSVILLNKKLPFIFSTPGLQKKRKTSMKKVEAPQVSPAHGHNHSHKQAAPSEADNIVKDFITGLQC
jgi:hypothetical protein